MPLRIFILLLSFLSHSAYAFVLLSGPKEARLPVSPQSPTITFYWDGSAPSLRAVDEVLGGRWIGLSDHDLMREAILYAFNVWNEVPGSYLRFALVEDTSVSPDTSDKKNVIVVKRDKNVTSAAYALPNVENKTIVDCDINVADHAVNLSDMLYILTHELGHCIGLGHAHANYGAIMGYSRSRRNTRLGADDMAGLLYLYPDPAMFDGKSQSFGACGKASAVQPNSRGQRAIALSFLLPLFLVGLCRRRKP